MEDKDKGDIGGLVGKGGDKTTPGQPLEEMTAHGIKWVDRRGVRDQETTKIGTPDPSGLIIFLLGYSAGVGILIYAVYEYSKKQ